MFKFIIILLYVTIYYNTSSKYMIFSACYNVKSFYKSEESMGNSKELTQQQENFCKYYVDIGIGSQAYIKAYPKAVNWNRNSLDCQVHKMLSNPKIDHRINELNEQKTSVLMQSTKLNKRKLLETALQMLQDTNNPQERGHAVNLIKLLFSKEGMTSPESVTQVNIQNNNTVTEITNYLDL